MRLRQVKSGPSKDKPAEVVMSFITDAGFISSVALNCKRGGVCLSGACGEVTKGVTMMLTALKGTFACLKAKAIEAGIVSSGERLIESGLASSKELWHAHSRTKPSCIGNLKRSLRMVQV
jgi:hypothetical protein